MCFISWVHCAETLWRFLINSSIVNEGKARNQGLYMRRGRNTIRDTSLMIAFLTWSCFFLYLVDWLGYIYWPFKMSLTASCQHAERYVERPRKTFSLLNSLCLRHHWLTKRHGCAGCVYINRIANTLMDIALIAKPTSGYFQLVEEFKNGTWIPWKVITRHHCLWAEQPRIAWQSGYVVPPVSHGSDPGWS